MKIIYRVSMENIREKAISENIMAETAYEAANSFMLRNFIGNARGSLSPAEEHENSYPTEVVWFADTSVGHEVGSRKRLKVTCLLSDYNRVKT